MNLNLQGAGEEWVDVSESVFGVAFNEPLVHQAVTAYLAGARAGTRAQKSRGMVRGGGSKPWRQKGTGRARAGTIRSPLWRGGGKVFPAQPRDYSQKLNRKMYRGAMRAILSELVRTERLVAVPTFNVSGPKTRELNGKLAELGMGDVLIVTEEMDTVLGLAARNLQAVDVCAVAAVDPVSLIAFEKVLITVPAIRRLEELLQ